MLRFENGTSVSVGEACFSTCAYSVETRLPISNRSPSCAYFQPMCSTQISECTNLVARIRTSSLICCSFGFWDVTRITEEDASW